MTRTSTLKIVSAAMTIAALSTPSVADVLPPNGNVALGGTTLALSPWLQGGSPGGQAPQFQVLDANNNVVFSGTLLVSFTDSNPFSRRYCNYRVQGTSGVAGRAIARIEFGGFGTRQVDAEYRTDLPAGTVPNVVSRTPDGDTVAFQFAGLAPGATSQFFYIFTGSPDIVFTGTARIVLNTGESAMVSGLPVPAPLVECEGDTNGDGVINFTDLNGVLTNFGEPCP